MKPWLGLLFMVLGSLCWAESPVQSHCNLQFEQALTVDGQSLEVADLRFGRDGSLHSGGELLSLSADQQALVAEYTDQLQALVPELLALVRDSLKLVSRALGETFAELFGHDSEVARETERALTRASDNLNQRIQQQDGRIHLRAGDDDLFEEAFGDEFDQAVDKAVEDSVGSGMSLIWRALFEPGFSERMEQFGERLEAEMETAAQALEARGDALCERARKSEQLERRLRESVPELAHFQLVNVAAEAQAPDQ